MKRSLIALFFVSLASAVSAADRWHVYFGCYTGGAGGSKGIMVADFDSGTGQLGAATLAVESGSPSFLAVHPTGKYLYAVGEMASAGRKGGAVSAFAVQQPEGRLRLINQVDSQGAAPCHISLDGSGRMAMVANYAGGSVASYKIGGDGALAGPVSFIQHEGSSADAARQQGPHAHSANRSPDNRFALVCDLGLDKVFSYKMDPAAGSLAAGEVALLPPGSGPRHLAFHPSGKFVFVNNEMLLTETTFAYAAESGKLTLVDAVSTVPPEDRERKGLSTAETVVHPNGKVVYVSNRGHDTIAVFSCDPGTGRLTLIQNAAAGGRTPRNFNLDPSGRWMIVAHQDSHTVTVLAVDGASGRLRPTGQSVAVGGAVCVRFLAAE